MSAQDADQAALDALFADHLFGPAVLLEGTAAVQIGALRPPRDLLRVLDQPVGILRSQDLDEMAAAHAEHPIDDAFESRCPAAPAELEKTGASSRRVLLTPWFHAQGDRPTRYRVGRSPLTRV